MTKTIAVICLLACTGLAGMAQNRATIKGKVTDSVTNEAMEFATVAVVSLTDSSLVSYTTTVKTGDFVLHNLPVEKNLKLVISFVGYNNYRKIINLEKGALRDIGSVKLSNKMSTLSEVKITAEVMPIIMKKDTIEFSAEAFKTPPNAVVEELLKRLPGIQVDMDGTISVNGKKIKKLLIDGKQYFANDPRIASRNLDANMIDKVQVYDDRDDDPDHLIPDAKVEKIINLKLKSAIKKSVSGKLHGGPGTRDRYDAGVLYNMFRDTLQISLIGLSNNLSRTGFSQGDLTSLGGFNRSGNEGLGYNGLATGGRSGGIQTVTSGGANINTDYGKKLKINLLYYYSYTNTNYNSTVFKQQFFSDTTLSTASTGQFTDITNKHNISGLVEWNPDTTVKLRYLPKVNFNTENYTNLDNNNSYNNFLPQLNSSTNSSNTNNRSFQFQQTFSYYKRLHKKGETLTINHSLNISPGSGLAYGINNFTSYTTVLPSSNLNRLGDNSTSTADASLGITYRYPFTKKLTGDVALNGNYNHNNGRLFEYDANPQTGQYNIYIDSLSNNLTRRLITETVKPELTFKPNKQVTIIGSLGVQFIQVYNQFTKNVPDINHFNTYLLPGISFSNAKFSFSYSENISQPSINDLRPYSTSYSQLYRSIGNPSLLPARSHNITGTYYTNKTESLLSTSIYGSFNYNENSVFTESTINSQDATFSKPVNKSGDYYYNVGGSISKGFKKFNNWQIRLSTSLSDYTRHGYFQVNNNEGFQNTMSLNLYQTVFVNWNNKFEINPSYNLSPSITTYQQLVYNSVKYVTQSLGVPIVVKWIPHTTIESTYNYTYNPLVAAGFQKSINILNLSVARQFQFRDRGEIKLSCYDLFDQNISNYRYASANSVSDIQTMILKRYFLLSYSYRFASTTPKKK